MVPDISYFSSILTFQHIDCDSIGDKEHTYRLRAVVGFTVAIALGGAVS